MLIGNKKLLYTSSTGAIRTTVDLATNVTGAVVGATSTIFMDATGKAVSAVPTALGGKEQLNQQVRDRAFASSCVTTAHICSEHLVEFGMWLIVSYVWHRKG